MLNRMNKKGVSLVELMIALVILLIVFIGLIQMSIVSIQSNMKNILRDEAVRIATDRITRLKTIDFDDGLLTDTSGAFVADDMDPLTGGVQNTVSRDFRSVTRQFTVTKDIADDGADYKEITVRVAWDWQGENFTYDISAPRGR